MLGAVYLGERFDEASAGKEIVSLCRQIRELVPSNSFSLFSTLRQFRRYLGYWPRDNWNELASGAIDALNGTERANAERSQAGVRTA